jgi:hypothetical protein
MKYMISVQHFWEMSVPRATSAAAVSKAEQMIGTGMKDVQITDTEAGRTYGPAEFHLLMRGS